MTPERQARALPTRLFQFLYHLPVWWFFAPIGTILILRIAYLRIANISSANISRFHCLWAIGTTGFAGMALELILIFAFQNIYGYLYQKAGLIVAVFMIGLAAGGYASYSLVTRSVRTSSHKVRVYLLSIEVSIVIFALLLPHCLRLLSALNAPSLVEIFFMILVGFSGILTGTEFPLARVLHPLHYT